MEMDLHVHTRYSFDSEMDPRKVVKTAIARGLDVIAITDHNVIDGAYEVASIAPPELRVIIGEEVSTDSGDIIGLFLETVIEESDPAKVIDEIHRQGGLAILPHPFIRNMTIDDDIAEKLDGCEGFNARYADMEIYRVPAKRESIYEFARQYDLTITASSDAHRYREIGAARTVVSGSTLEEIRVALEKGETSILGDVKTPVEQFMKQVERVTRKIIHPIPDEYVR